MAVSLKRSSARVAPRSVIRAAATSAMMSSTVGGVGLDGAGAGHVADGAEAHDHALDGLVAGRWAGSRLVGQQHAVALEDLALVGEVDRGHLDVLAARCTARRRARSSWRAGRRACARRGGCGRCRGSRARAAGLAGPTGRTRRGARRRAPWRGPSPRRGGRRRRRRRTVLLDGVEQGRRSGAGCATGCPAPRARGPCRSSPGRRPRRGARRAPSTRRSRNSRTSGKLWPVSTCMTGKGNLAGQNAFSARRSITIESLPPENSSTGRSNSAATSRMMWIDSASRASRWLMRRRRERSVSGLVSIIGQIRPLLGSGAASHGDGSPSGATTKDWRDRDAPRQRPDSMFPTEVIDIIGKVRLGGVYPASRPRRCRTLEPTRAYGHSRTTASRPRTTTDGQRAA